MNNPACSSNDMADDAEVNTVLFAEIGVRDASSGISFSDLRDFRPRQFVVGVPLTMGATSFLCHVLRVFGSSSKEQMVGTDAKPIVAVMKDAQMIGDRTIRPLIRKAMSEFRPSALNIGANLAVAVDVWPPRPSPARLGLFNFRPESFLNWLRSRWHPSSPFGFYVYYTTGIAS